MRKILARFHRPQIRKVMYLLFVFLLIVGIKANSQGGISDPGTDPDSAPVDGGLSLLIVGGIGYGIKKMREKKS